MKTRELFSTRIATILTMIGVAVGLGNVWRFPYMMGQHGGSAFLVIYIVFVLIIAIPAITAEWSLGRYARHGPIGAMQLAFGPMGRWIGYLLVSTVFIASTYYTVIVGNVAFSAFFAIASGFTPATIPVYEAQLGNGVLQASVTYELRTNTRLSAGVDIFYGKPEGLFGQFDKNDRISIGIEVGF